MNGQGFFHSFGQTARGARIQMHEFAMQSVQRLFGSSIVFERVSRIQLLGNDWLILVRDVPSRT